MWRQDDQLFAQPSGGPGAEHLREQRLDEVFRLDTEAVAGVVDEPWAAKQVGTHLFLRETSSYHERVGEDALAAVPMRLLRIV